MLDDASVTNDMARDRPVPEKRRAGVLLLAHGAPERIEDIPEFLLNVRGGRNLPDAAVREITGRYAQIGGGSPLLKVSRLQAARLAEVLNETTDTGRPRNAGCSIPVAVGMRNWKPLIPDAVRQLCGVGIGKLIAVCLAPQNSSTSVGLYRKVLQQSIAEIWPGMEVDFIESWHDHPGLIAAFGEKVCRALDRVGWNERQAVPVIFTAHSVPQKTIDSGDPYRGQVEETAKLVAESASLRVWSLAFQSQGITQDVWIGPTVESEIDRLASEGHRRALIAPIGFVSDHVEILYDVDILFRKYAERKGLAVWRTESLNDSPLFIKGLASMVEAHM